MYNITNIEELGTEYTVADTEGKILNTIQIIPHSEILEAALGEYTEIEFGNYENYLKKSVEVLAGFENVDPNKILWYATYDEEVVLAEVIQIAIQNGYNKIILEHLEDLDDIE
jgi:hypothetical protein